ncbi:MAG: hypothetical protein H6834_06365 [Planctomycetes bacterium]|nr:hypothetical protein [Planctomycetota bacterium]
MVHSLTDWRVIRLSWWMIGLSMAAFAGLGMFAFGEPLAPPSALAAYDGLPRRLLRLAHVAAIALPVLNLHYLPWLRRTETTARIRARARLALTIGTLGIPTLLAVAAFLRPALYALPLPVLCMTGAMFFLATHLGRTPRDHGRTS